MLGRPNLTERILAFLADLDEAMDYPRSFSQMLNWDKHQYYKNLDRLKTQEKRQRRRIKQTLWRLEKSAIVTYEARGKRYSLTPAGWLKYLYYYNQRNTKKPKQAGIEKFFIIFDIPEKYRRFRNLFRECLQNLGCRMEQRSVFQTSSQEVFKFAQKIVSNCELEGNVRFIEAKKIF